jgi:hypothetical protein
MLTGLQALDRVRSRLRVRSEQDARRPLGGLLSAAVAGAADAALLEAATQAGRVAARARQALGRGLSCLEEFALLQHAAGSPPDTAAPPVVVTSDRAASAGEWLVIDATTQDVALAVEASSPGDELRVRRADASSFTVRLVGGFTHELGPGHAVLLKGELGGSWGLW